jgi:acyl carrier protein
MTIRDDGAILREVTQLCRLLLERDDVVLSPETSFEELEGWDSLLSVDLLMAIEDQFGVNLGDAEIFTRMSAGELSDAVATVTREQRGTSDL